MPANTYYITNESSEDRLDCADNLSDAIRIARELAGEEQMGETICIEHKGLTIRQFVRKPDGKVEEAEIS